MHSDAGILAPSDYASHQTVSLIAGNGLILRPHQNLILILFFSFLVSVFLADWTSYWYNELLSVKIFGTDHHSIVSAIKQLAVQSTHPPLHHLILFYWMQVFGDTELATRILSAIFIAFSSLFLYLMVLQNISKRIALASTLFYSLSYTSLYNALQTTPYPQTLFLCVLSSFLLFKWLKFKGSFSWRAMLLDPYAILIIICNVSLLLTHYYNAFFLAAQAVFVLLYFLTKNPKEGPLFNTMKVGVFYLVQAALVIVIWGPVFFSTYARKAGKYTTDAPTNPLSMLMDMIIRENVAFMPAWLAAVLLATVVLYTARAFLKTSNHHTNQTNSRADFLIYLLFWMIGSFVVVYLVFLATGFERLKTRYFIFCVPPLSILLVISLEQLIAIVDARARLFGFSFRRHYIANATVYALLVCAIFILPRSYAAATDRKEPFREIAQSIIRLVSADRNSRYLIYEAGERGEPMLNYYFRKFSRRVRANGTFLLQDEQRGRSSLESAAQLLAQHDYLVIAFPHRRMGLFPQTQKLLSQTYDIHTSQMNKGRGYIVYSVRSLGKRTPSAPSLPDRGATMPLDQVQ